MLNEYGERLDWNGYAPSIIPGHSECQCFLCGRNGQQDKLDRHEVFGGAYRNKSKRLGLWVHLCHKRCHQEMPGAVHRNAGQMQRLRRCGQLKAMETYGWTEDEFRAEFGKNYLGGETDDTD